MNTDTSHLRAHSATLAALLGSASCVAWAATGVAQAQTKVQAKASTMPAEQVLVTGSLIRGTAAVGVPVTNFSTQDFLETGQLKLADTLKAIPALQIYQEESPTFGGGTLSFELNVEIHGLGTGSG